MEWYYHLNSQNVGPVTEADLRALQQQNTIQPDTLVWTQGMPAWAPYGSSSAASAAPAATLVSGPTHACVECGRVFPEGEMLRYENSWVCPECKPVFFQRVREGVQPLGTMSYATVSRRFAAVFLDGIMLYLIFLIPRYLLFGSLFAVNSDAAGLSVTFFLVQTIVNIAYDIFFIGKFGATVGKMLMKVKVVRSDGSRVSYARATGRHFAKSLSALILFIGYLMAFWDPEKRTLHDRMCDTRVINSRAP